jgi:Fe-S-cluster formation regulator IscX/YfhJ
MAGFTQEHKRIVDYVTPQGVTTTRTTKGLLFRFPNGETEMLHYTVSDWRGTRNFRANLRRNGIEYPGDYSDRKNKKPPMKSSIERVKEALKDLDPDRVTTVQLHAKLTEHGQTMNTSTIQHVMIHLGYWHDYKPSKSRKTFVWHPPIDPKEIIEPVEDMKNLVEYADDTTDQTDANGETVIVSIPKETHIPMVIDDRNSWPVQLDHLDGTITIDQLRIIYMAAGLNVEMRVWR